MVERHNHFKIGINDLELLYYRFGKSKSLFRECSKSLFATTLKRLQNHSHTTRFGIIYMYYIYNTKNASPSRLAVLEAG